MIEYIQSAGDNDKRADKNISNELEIDHGLVGASRRLSQHVMIDRFDAQRLRRRTVHDYVDPEYLHGVEWTREVEYGRKGDQ
jgi:hypothetical protein